MARKQTEIFTAVQNPNIVTFALSTKVAIKMAQDLLDRFFRDAEGRTNRQIDVFFTLEDMGLPRERADEGLEYLTSRGLINMFGPDIAFLTDAGVNAISSEKSIANMPKAVREFAATPPPNAVPARSGGARPAQDPPPPAGAAPQLPRSDRPLLTYADPDGTEYAVELGWACSIGRAEGNDIHLNDQRASKRHAEIKFDGTRFVLRDLGAANGTLVNGGYVDAHILQHSDEILIGRTTLAFTCPVVLRPPAGAPPADLVDPALAAETPETETERPESRADAAALPHTAPAAAASASQMRVVKGRPDAKAAGPSDDLFETPARPSEPQIPPFPPPSGDLFTDPSRLQPKTAHRVGPEQLFDAREPVPAQLFEGRLDATMHRGQRPDLFEDQEQGPPGDLFDHAAQPSPFDHEPLPPAALADEAPPELLDPDIEEGEPVLLDDPIVPLDHPAAYPLDPVEAMDPVDSMDPMDPIDAEEPLEPLEALESLDPRSPPEPTTASRAQPYRSEPPPDEDDVLHASTLIVNRARSAPARPIGDEVDRAPAPGLAGPMGEDDTHAGAAPVRGGVEPWEERTPSEDVAIDDLRPAGRAGGSAARRGDTDAQRTVLLTSAGEVLESNLVDDDGLDQERATGDMISSEIDTQRELQSEPGFPLPVVEPDDTQSTTADVTPSPRGRRLRRGDEQNHAAFKRRPVADARLGGEELPEAPVSLPDPGPIAPSIQEYQETFTAAPQDPAFFRTLQHLQSQVAGADLPDREDLLAALELIDRHPYIRMAVAGRAAR